MHKRIRHYFGFSEVCSRKFSTSWLNSSAYLRWILCLPSGIRCNLDFRHKKKGSPQPEGLLPAPRDLRLLHPAVHHLPAAAARAAGPAFTREPGRQRELHPTDAAASGGAAPPTGQDRRGLRPRPRHAVAPHDHRGRHVVVTMIHSGVAKRKNIVLEQVYLKSVCVK